MSLTVKYWSGSQMSQTFMDTTSLIKWQNVAASAEEFDQTLEVFRVPKLPDGTRNSKLITEIEKLLQKHEK